MIYKKGVISMYKVLKEKGNNQNVTVRNVETKGEVIIGRISIEIMNKLEEAGIKVNGIIAVLPDNCVEYEPRYVHVYRIREDLYVELSVDHVVY